MRYAYCPDCGEKLTEREIGDEGLVPYCETCEKPWFDGFPTCVITLVTDGLGRVALLKQNYLSTEYMNLVSGYMKPGETAEEAAAREVWEELGLRVDTPRVTGTYWYEKKGLLMVCLTAKTRDAAFTLSKEVDAARWAEAEAALTLVHPRGTASHGMIEQYINAGRSHG